VVISYRRFGTTCVQGSRSLTHEHGSSSHLTRCRNLISSNMLNLSCLLCELMYSHRRFGTSYRSHLQGKRILTREHGSSSQLTHCRNLISSNMLNLPRFLRELMCKPPTFRDYLSVPSNWRQNSEIMQHAQCVTWCAVTFKNALNLLKPTGYVMHHPV